MEEREGTFESHIRNRKEVDERSERDFLRIFSRYNRLQYEFSTTGGLGPPEAEATEIFDSTFKERSLGMLSGFAVITSIVGFLRNV